MVLEFFDLVSGVDECFISVQRLYEVVDGACVYRRVALVTPCVSCLCYMWLSNAESGL